MATQNDQPRPDLDAAIDAVLPLLTAVSDEAAANSLRRTRIALADAAPGRAAAGIGAWRWAVPVILMTTVLVAVMLWRPRAPVDGPPAVVATTHPQASAAPATASSARPPLVAPIVVPRPAIRQEPRRVRATSAPVAPTPPTPDPLIALARAVQDIPEVAWSAMARAQAPLTTPGLGIAPIVVPPLTTSSIPETSAAPPVLGEP